MAHSAPRARGVHAIARCCTWPRAERRISASSECSPGNHALTGNTPGNRPLSLRDKGVSPRKTLGSGGKRVSVSAGVAGKGCICCVHGGGRFRALLGHPWHQCVNWDAVPCQHPLSLGRLQFPLPICGAGCRWQARGGAGEGVQPRWQQDTDGGTGLVLPRCQPRVLPEGAHGPGTCGEGRDGLRSSALVLSLSLPVPLPP